MHSNNNYNIVENKNLSRLVVIIFIFFCIIISRTLRFRKSTGFDIHILFSTTVVRIAFCSFQYLMSCILNVQHSATGYKFHIQKTCYGWQNGIMVAEEEHYVLISWHWIKRDSTNSWLTVLLFLIKVVYHYHTVKICDGFFFII